MFVGQSSGSSALLARQAARPVLRAVVRERALDPDQNLILQGEAPQVAHILLSGYTCRHRTLMNGRRQITAILVPGDMCDLEAVLRGWADSGITALTRCVFGEIPLEQVADPLRQEPELARALLHQLLYQKAIDSERVLSLGQRTALQRLAHLFCELQERLQAVGLAEEDGYSLPLTQMELSELTGMTNVHVNRTLQALRGQNLVRWHRGRLSLLDRPALERLAEFDPTYLRVP
ncbi:Crp/Fnr family transcriptional regulator [Methylobacterium durans]|uniref:Crp/Fnr family transcriptional regulator n=2 Tax=Methylobacterium durans TaxID=2202825 RepID=A0A2U8W2I2_9HYPH|nr:Crp/Fnr family transcriptional regulator [Methylobacterium durans]